MGLCPKLIMFVDPNEEVDEKFGKFEYVDYEDHGIEKPLQKALPEYLHKYIYLSEVSTYDIEAYEKLIGETGLEIEGMSGDQYDTYLDLSNGNSVPCDKFPECIEYVETIAYKVIMDLGGTQDFHDVVFDMYEDKTCCRSLFDLKHLDKIYKLSPLKVFQIEEALSEYPNDIHKIYIEIGY